MAYKLPEMAQAHWRQLGCAHPPAARRAVAEDPLDDEGRAALPLIAPPRRYDARNCNRSARERSHSTNTKTVPTPRTATFLTHRVSTAR